MAVRSAMKQHVEKCPEEPRWKGTCYYYEKEGHLKQDCPQASKPPGLPVGSVKDHTWGETALWGTGPTVRLSGQSGLKVPRDPHTCSCPNNTRGTPGINNCGGPISRFLLDTGATLSVFTEAPDPPDWLPEWDCLDGPNVIISVVLYAATGTLYYFLMSFH